jgi:hypothetical protein
MRIATVHGSLAPCEPVFTHGDLGADQLLVDRSRLSVTDWDEAANGDPHFDHAWLTADLRGRGLETAWVESLARQVLGERFDTARFAWQCAAAEARRAIEGLHRCRADWRALALDRLEAAEHALTLVPAMTTQARRRGASTWLAALLDPQLRRDVPGLIAGISRVAAVWPETDKRRRSSDSHASVTPRRWSAGCGSGSTSRPTTSPGIRGCRRWRRCSRRGASESPGTGSASAPRCASRAAHASCSCARRACWTEPTHGCATRTDG